MFAVVGSRRGCKGLLVVKGDVDEGSRDRGASQWVSDGGADGTVHGLHGSQGDCLLPASPGARRTRASRAGIPPER